MELAHVKVGDQLSVTVHEGGTIVLTPVRPVIDPLGASATAKRLIGKNAALFNASREQTARASHSPVQCAQFIEQVL